MIRAALRKEFQLVLRDRGTLLSLFLLPLVFVTVFGSLFGPAGGAHGRAQPIAVYAPEASPIVQRLEASGLFAVRRVPSPAELDAWVAKDSAHIGLLVSADSASTLLVDKATPLRFRGPIESSLRELLSPPKAPSESLVVRSPVGKRTAGEQPSGFQLAVPGNAVLFGFFLALTMALSIVEERRSGTWLRLRAAPVRRGHLILAKLVPFYAIGLVQMLVLFAVGALAFDMRVLGSLSALAVLTCAMVAAAVSLGLLLASFGGTAKQIGSVGSILLLVMGLVGGAMIPRVTMPEGMQDLGLATPHAWALDGYHTLLLRHGASLADVAMPCSMLLAFALAFAAIGTVRLR